MATHAYTEDQLVEQPAIGLFAELGWQTVSAMEEIFGKDTGTLRRETPAEVVLESRLRGALSTLNPNLPAEVFDAAVVELTRDRSAILEDLLKFAGSLSAEQERHVREHLSEEELTVFGILTRPGPELSPEEREEVKKVARQVLERLRTLLALDWRRQTQARAQVRLAIEDTLDQGLPRAYTPELYQGKCSALFEHVFESYQGEGVSVYAGAA